MKTYEAKYDPQNSLGVYAISLVENPAMEGLFIALSKDQPIQLKTVNEEQRILMGLVLEPNKPIYRNNGGEEYNVVFTENVIRDLSYGFFKNNYQTNSTIEHVDAQTLKNVTFTESWIIENPKIDKSTNFGFNYPKGSWMAVMKVDDDAIWNDYIKTGKVQGFSIDAMLSLEEVNLKSNINMSKSESLLEKILMALTPSKKIQLGKVKLADGSLEIEFDGEVLEAGISCWVNAEDNTKVPVPVGEHPLEDGTILVVEQEGIVKEVKQAEAPAEEPAPTQEMSEPTDGKVSKDAKIASEIESAIKSIMIKYEAQEKETIELKKETLELKAQIVELKNQIAEFGKEPSAKPIVKTKVELNSNKQYSNLLEKLNNL